MSDCEIDGENIVRKIAGTFTFVWLIAAALMPAKGSEAGQPEKSQGGTMQMTEPNNQGTTLSPEDVRTRVAKGVVAERDIGVDQLHAASVQLLPPDGAEQAE